MSQLRFTMNCHSGIVFPRYGLCVPFRPRARHSGLDVVTTVNKPTITKKTISGNAARQSPAERTVIGPSVNEQAPPQTAASKPTATKKKGEDNAEHNPAAGGSRGPPVNKQALPRPAARRPRVTITKRRDENTVAEQTPAERGATGQAVDGQAHTHVSASKPRATKTKGGVAQKPADEDATEPPVEHAVPQVAARKPRATKKKAENSAAEQRPPSNGVGYSPEDQPAVQPSLADATKKSQKSSAATKRTKDTKTSEQPAGDQAVTEPAAKAKTTGRKKKAATALSPPSAPLPVGEQVLPQPAAVILDLINQEHLTTLREILVGRGIKHQTALKHLLVLLDVGELEEQAVLDLYELHLGPPHGLTKAIIQEALSTVPRRNGSGLSRKQAVLQHLEQQQPEAVQAQEAKLEGLTTMQIDLVEQLLKRAPDAGKTGKTATGTAASSISSDAVAEVANGAKLSPEAIAQRLLSKADLRRVQGYLEGRTVEEIRRPPYSKAPEVTARIALGSLINACKAGVQLPLERLLADFHLDKGPAGLTWMDITSAMGNTMDLVRQAVATMTFYESTRRELLKNDSLRDKIMAQEKEVAGGLDLTLLQIRLVYYLQMAEILRPQ